MWYGILRFRFFVDCSSSLSLPLCLSVLDRRNGNVLLCESDDIYFVYNCKKGQLEDWFIHMTKMKSHQQEDKC